MNFRNAFHKSVPKIGETITTKK